MGSQLGKVVREIRQATRDVNFSAMISGDEPRQQTTYSHTPTQPTQPTSQVSDTETSMANTTAPASERIVEGASEHTEDSTN
jgi:hypothetical protein